MATLIDWTDSWRLLGFQPLRSLSPPDPIGFSAPTYDDSSWPWADGAFADGPTIAVPSTMSTPYGPIPFQSRMGWNGEAYYRRQVATSGGPLTVDIYIDNWVWVWVEGTLIGQAFYDDGAGAASFTSASLPAGAYQVAIRSRSTGDAPAGGHLLAARVSGNPAAPGTGWTVGRVGVAAPSIGP